VLRFCCSNRSEIIEWEGGTAPARGGGWRGKSRRTEGAPCRPPLLRR
jgi:hypothetical protein